MKVLVMVAALFMSGALLVPTLANAGQHKGSELEKVTAEIRYSPRDLRTPDGVERFHAEVDKTIQKMCSDGRESMVGMFKDTQRCIADARLKAAPQVELALESASNR